MRSWKIYFYAQIVRLLPETKFFGVKRALLRWCGAKIGRNVRICSSVRILGVGHIEIGDDTWIGHYATIIAMSPATVRIGACVDIAPEVCIFTGTHEIDASGAHTAGKGCNIDVTIGDGAWLCARSTILPGVTIGGKSVIAAGALINRDVGERKIVAGIPAKVIKDI